MTDNPTYPVLLITGTVGAGKSAVGLAVHDRLRELELASAFLDLDSLTCLWPPASPFNEAILLEALRVLWPLYRDAGAERLILARVVERQETVEACAEALGDIDITLVRLTASEEARRARIETRERGDARRWHLDRTVELERILTDAALEQFLVVNEDRTIEETADEMLKLIGWVT